MPKLIDLTNQRFGRLVVLHRGDNNNQGKPRWVVKCDCGNVIQVCGTSLKSGNTQSCGCIKSEIVVAKNKENAVHGEAGSRLYRIWIGMKTRCYNPKYNQYKDYGGRGIRICEEWLDFQTFYDWAMTNGYNPNAKRGECTIDFETQIYEIANNLYNSGYRKKEEIEKQVAKEIFQDIYQKLAINYVDDGYQDEYIDTACLYEDLEDIAKKYGVEVE